MVIITVLVLLCIAGGSIAMYVFPPSELFKSIRKNTEDKTDDLDEQNNLDPDPQPDPEPEPEIQSVKVTIHTVEVGKGWDAWSYPDIFAVIEVEDDRRYSDTWDESHKADMEWPETFSVSDMVGIKIEIWDEDETSHDFIEGFGVSEGEKDHVIYDGEKANVEYSVDYIYG